MESELKIGDICTITVRKFDPTRDKEPYYVTYEVPYTREMRVLEALDYIVEELGESLAYQWYCGVKKCGGCGLSINKKPMLACWEPVQKEMVIEPMPNLPVLKDLVIDRTRYERDLVRMMPNLERHAEYPGFPESLTPEQMGHSIELMHCIECLLCNSVCPAYDESSAFVGPAPLVQLARFALDPRDGAPRAELAVEKADIRDCTNCYECVEACPTGINPLEHAIDPLRNMIVKEELGSVAHHNKVFCDLVVEQGIVNPSTLLLRSRGISVLSEINMAIQMWLKGRLSIAKIFSGLLKTDHLQTQEELTQLTQAVRNLQQEKSQQ